MTVTAENYRLAEKLVLQRYASEMDENERHLHKWRIAAIEQHRKDGTDGSVMNTFAEDVDNIVTLIVENKLVAAASIIPKKKKLQSVPKTVSASPIEPASPDNFSLN
jgi:transposase-like protein